jgi:hypothetical protein
MVYEYMHFLNSFEHFSCLSPTECLQNFELKEYKSFLLCITHPFDSQTFKSAVRFIMYLLFRDLFSGRLHSKTVESNNFATIKMPVQLPQIRAAL